MNKDTLVFKGARFEVHDIAISKNGKTFHREAVLHPGAVVILPFKTRIPLL